MTVIKTTIPVRWMPRDGQGVTIVSQYTKYVASTDGVNRPTEDWSIDFPNTKDGVYIWSWTHVTYSDGTSTDSYSVSKKGIDGKGIKSSIVSYSQKETYVKPEDIAEEDWSATYPDKLNEGWWLYTRTVITYSEGISTTTSYQVSQVGTGSHYAGVQEYYAASKSAVDIPPHYAGYVAGQPEPTFPITYPEGETITIGGSWSQQRPTLSTETPYLWNFEISADSKGNRYVTRPICIGNFAKGIVSIVETYAVSAHFTPDKEGQDYPSDITAWDDEHFNAQPTDEKPYQWNKTETTYNDGTTDTRYHVSSIKGIDGKGAVYVDLDNENDSIVYDVNNVAQNSVSTNINLYDNGVTKTPDSIKIEKHNVVYELSGKTLTVTAVTSSVGYADVVCSYKGKEYRARMSIKKLVNQDRMNLNVTPTHITYNASTGEMSSKTVSVDVMYTTPQGVTQKWVTPSETDVSYIYRLSLDGGSSYIAINGTMTFNVLPTTKQLRIDLYKIPKSGGTSVIVDTETVIVDTIKNGDNVISVDLDNDMTSVPLTNDGVTENAVSASTKVKLYNGTKPLTLTDVQAVANTDKVKVTVHKDLQGNPTGQVSVNAEKGVAIGDKILVNITATSGTYSKSIIFTVHGIRAGVQGEKATIYELFPSMNSVSFHRESNGALTPESYTVYVDLKKVVGDSYEVLKRLPEGFKMYYRYNSMPDSISGLSELPIVQNRPYIDVKNSDKNNNLNLLLAKDGIIIDKESIPILYDGEKGADGAGSYLLDLDNDTDTILYDDSGNKLSGSVTTNVQLYYKGEAHDKGVTYSVKESAGCSYELYGKKLTVTGLTDVSAYVLLNAKIEGISSEYTAMFTVKKIIGEAKYEISTDVKTLSYNKSTETGNVAKKFNVNVYRTCNGVREKVMSLSKYGLSLYVTKVGTQNLTKEYFLGEDGNLEVSVVVNRFIRATVTLKKGDVIHDEESVTVLAVSNGIGQPGETSVNMYNAGFDKPSKPTSTTDASWSKDIPVQDDIKVSFNGEWSLCGDGYAEPPKIVSGQSVQVFDILTTKDNQTVKVHVSSKVLASSNYVYVGKVDALDPTTDYAERISSQQILSKTVNITVPNAGAHTISIAYVHSGSSVDGEYVKAFVGKMPVWISSGNDTDGFNDVYKYIDIEPMQDKPVTRPNLLYQTSFIDNLMDKWYNRNVLTAQGLDGKNAVVSAVDVNNDRIGYMLCQEVSLSAYRWHTLSFYAKTSGYYSILKRTTDISSSNTYTASAYLTAARHYVKVTGSWISGKAYLSYGSVTLELENYFYIDITSPGKYTFTISGEAKLTNVQIDKGTNRLRINSLYDGVSGVVVDGVQNPASNKNYINIGKEWRKHTVTFRTGSSGSGSIDFALEKTFNDVYICQPKLEEGVNATAYCANDDDIVYDASQRSGFPFDCGLYNSSTTYQWSDTRRDSVLYPYGGKLTRFAVKRKGQSFSGIAPTQPSAYWEKGDEYNLIVANTIFGENANIGGFMASEERLVSKSGRFILDGQNGEMHLEQDNGNAWSVDASGKQSLGQDNGQRIELDPNMKQMRIYNDKNAQVAEFSGVEMTMDGIFGDSKGSAGDMPQINYKYYSHEGIAQETITVSSFTLVANSQVSIVGNIEASAIGISTQGKRNSSEITLWLCRVIDIDGETQYAHLMSFSASAYSESSSKQTIKTKRINDSITLPAGDYAIRASYRMTNVIGNAQGTYFYYKVDSITWSSDFYLSRVGANGFSYGFNANNHFTVLKEVDKEGNKSMRMKFVMDTLQGLQGFEMRGNFYRYFRGYHFPVPVTIAHIKYDATSNDPISGYWVGKGQLDTIIISSTKLSTAKGTYKFHFNPPSMFFHIIQYPDKLSIYGTGIQSSGNNCYISVVETVVEERDVHVTVAVGDDASPNDGMSFFLRVDYIPW